MFTKRISVVVLFFASAALSAEPIYLQCTLPSEGRPFAFEVKVGEASNKITQTQDNGITFNAEGFFTANAIRYQKADVIGGLLKITMVYEINRTTLQIARSMKTEQAMGSPSRESAGSGAADQIGKCEILKVSERKI